MSFEKEAPIVAEKLGHKMRANAYTQSKFLRNHQKEGKVLAKLMEIPEAIRPEFAGHMLTHFDRNKTMKQAIHELLRSLAPLWSRLEKERFLNDSSGARTHFSRRADEQNPMTNTTASIVLS